MRKNTRHTLALLAAIGLFLPVTAYANSSWNWLTETHPYDLLPYAVALTLLIEVIAIGRINAIHRPIRLMIVVCLANLASFLLPCALLFLPSPTGYTIEMAMAHLPIFIVGMGYLLLTLIVELPIVYACLQTLVEDTRRLLISIAAVNGVTTLLVALIERMVCRGAW